MIEKVLRFFSHIWEYFSILMVIGVIIFNIFESKLKQKKPSAQNTKSKARAGQKIPKEEQKKLHSAVGPQKKEPKTVENKYHPSLPAVKRSPSHLRCQQLKGRMKDSVIIKEILDKPVALRRRE